ncbi:MAB_1171c family putative transporter [Streptomyces purpureus]|uniref:MAB_1171c family putative transporter n=1 Tax=Streptomyces purpureus TaxID=1951 RepID=UPI00036FD838|nr:MAB_1171c family putative transporter [Streptomyces purpureus]
MIYGVLSWICAIGGLAAFGYRLPDLLRRKHDIALWALCTYFLCSGLSFLVDLDVLRLHISDLFGHANITSLIVQVLVVVLTAAQQVVLVYWSCPPDEARRRARRRVLFFAAALCVLVAASLAVSPVADSETATSTILRSIQDGGYAAYMSFYLLLCAVGQFETVRLSLRFTKMANRQWLKVGMRTVTLGASLIMVYCVTRGIQIAGTRLHFDGSALDPIQWTCGSIGALLQITGWTIPSWGIHLTRALGWLRSYRSYLRLRPLWWALYQASPDIALAPPRSWPRDIIPTRDPHYSLYRRVIEIRDGQLMLRTSLSLEDFSRMARSLRLPEDPTSPLGEALQVRAVLSRPPAERAERADATDIPVRPPYEDFRDEVEWLTKVASSFSALGRRRLGRDDAELLS